MSREVYQRAKQILREGIQGDLGTPQERKKTAKFAVATLACTTPFLLFVSRSAGMDIKTFGLAAVGTTIGTLALASGGAYSQARREIKTEQKVK
ncbi:MAG TPA: hypothetical protein VNA13_04460 [Xanthomonadales bacterium]|nr:hypothetical protein [Xanthomonadales bacterium]